MERFRIALIASILFGQCAWAETSSTSVGDAEDRAILAVVLEDFSKWDKATFGEQSGVLQVAPATLAQPNLSTERVRSLAPNIQAKVTDEMAAAFVRRNQSSVSVAEIAAGSRWVKVDGSENPFQDLRDLPPGVKAVGYLTLPGIGRNRTAALVQLNHSWSIHGAIITYVLARTSAGWKIVARDQTVFP